LRLTVVSTGTRDHSRVPVMRTALEEITRSGESSSRMSERGARVAPAAISKPSSIAWMSLRAAALALGEASVLE
jgi:hypothetical protein